MTDEVYDRAIQAEREILASVMIKPTILADALSLGLTPESFSKAAHKAVFAAMASVGVQGCDDLAIVVARLHLDGTFEAVGKYAGLSALLDGIADVSNAPEYVRIIKESSAYRQLIKLGTTLSETDKSKTLEALSAAHSELTDLLASSTVSKTIPLCEGEASVLSKLDDEPEDWLQTGFPTLDRLLVGLEPAAFIVLAARPSVGKTMAALQLSEYNASRGKSIAFFSLEMPAEALSRRMLCLTAQVRMDQFATRWFNPEQRVRMADAEKAARGYRFSIEDSSALSPSLLEARARIIAARDGLDLIVLDYLQLMASPEKAGSRYEAVTELSRQLKLTAKSLNVPIIALCQLNRASEMRTDKRPQLSDLRDSGAIEQDADVAILMHRKEDTGTGKDPVEIIVAKARNGKTGLTTFEADYPHQRFDDNDGAAGRET